MLSAQAQEIPIQVVDFTGKPLHTITAIARDATHYFNVDTLFTLFDANGRQRHIPLTGRLTLQLRDKRFELSVPRDRLRNRGTVEGEPFRLEHPPLSVQQPTGTGIGILIPAEFITEVVAPALDFIADFNPNAQRLQIREKQPIASFEEPISDTGSATLVLDPGHGGQDVGVSVSDEFIEKDITLRLCQQALEMAEALALPTFLTRTGDQSVSTLARVQEAARNGGGLFVSLHCNASFSPDVSGVRIYLNNPNGRLSFGETFATENVQEGDLSIQEASQIRFLTQSRRFAQALKLQLQEQLGLRVTEVQEVPLQPLAQAMMPAILVEVGFLSSPADQMFLTDPNQSTAFLQALLSTAQQFLGE